MPNRQPWPHCVSMIPDEVCDPQYKGTLPDVEITCYWGDDGFAVVEINTEGLPEDQDGPLMRVWLNDGMIWTNPDLGVVKEVNVDIIG